eukprot:TRINITY_DN2681_c0_g1_i1.p2 TRINITY_DN2681_c0_g1~~TRINITY_DN2681_c0_g1_i1.p2  ORF type:complete len:153 (+),score=34.44 TRINITY_DN2681_c0_g1_i1:286-744(+)
MGVTPLRDMPLCGSAHVACTILREVVSVKLAHDGDDRVMHAAEFEVADSTARCRLVAASKPVVSALRRRVGQPCIALNAAARSLPSKHETQAFRLVLPPSACVLPYPCSTEELDGLVCHKNNVQKPKPFSHALGRCASHAAAVVLYLRPPTG